MASKSDVSMHTLIGVALGYTILHGYMDFEDMPSTASLLITFQMTLIPLLPALGTMLMLGVVAVLALHADVQEAIKEEKQTDSQDNLKQADGTKYAGKSCSDLLSTLLVSLVAVAIPLIFTPTNRQAMFNLVFNPALMLSLQVTLLPVLPILGGAFLLCIPCVLAVHADVQDCMKEAQKVPEPAVHASQ